MLNFRPLALSDRPTLEPILTTRPYRVCDENFASLYIWQELYAAQFCVTDEAVYIRFSSDGQTLYLLPLCRQEYLPQALANIETDAAEHSTELRLSAMNAQQRAMVEQAMPNRFRFEEHPEYADYIYRSADLINLSGKKFHAKRNFINRFLAEFDGRHSFEAIDDANTPEILVFAARWAQNYGDDPYIIMEQSAIRRALEHRNELGLEGVVLRLDGAVIAFALGAPLCADTYLEIFEKAADTAGAYPMINNEFARRFCGKYEYINREEDMGLEGLRKAKRSYNPVMIDMRYTAVRRTEE